MVPADDSWCCGVLLHTAGAVFLPEGFLNTEPLPMTVSFHGFVRCPLSLWEILHLRLYIRTLRVDL